MKPLNAETVLGNKPVGLSADKAHGQLDAQHLICKCGDPDCDWTQAGKSSADSTRTLGRYASRFSMLPDPILDLVYHMSRSVAAETLRQLEGRPAEEIAGSLMQLLEQRAFGKYGESSGDQA